MARGVYLLIPQNMLKLLLKNGEIDIIEGVHDNEHNQVTWHTAPGMSPAWSQFPVPC